MNAILNALLAMAALIGMVAPALLVGVMTTASGIAVAPAVGLTFMLLSGVFCASALVYRIVG